MLDQLDEPNSISLTRDHWRAAALLAGLRKGVNDNQRSAHRSRGEFKNILNDLQGVLGELVALMTLEESGANIKSIQHNPIDFETHIDDVDLVVDGHDREYKIESKCLLVERNKSLFLVNQTAHNRSLNRNAEGYIPVLSVEGGREALVGSFTTTGEVSDWNEMDFGYGDPALGVDLSDYCPEKWGATENQIRQRLEPQRGHYGTVETDYSGIARRAASRIQHYERELPVLGELSANQMITALLQAS